jgi:AraC-like DNA-binding protein
VTLVRVRVADPALTRGGNPENIHHDRVVLTVSDVAFFLHYSELAAFHRAFRRWTGETPLSCRS